MITEAATPRSPVFIVGSPRSGTSATVDALIAAGYHGFREGNFLPLAQRIASEIDRHFSVFDIGCTKVLLGCVDKAMIKRKINDLFCSVVNSMNPEIPWFDKTGGSDMIRFLPTALLMWPRAAVVLSKRRAIENIVSRIKKFPKASFEHHCIDWARTMTAWREIKRTLPEKQFLEIDQFDMINNPSNTASVLARFLGLDRAHQEAVESMMTRTRPQETEIGSAKRVWVFEATGWSDQQREIFLKHCAAEMTAFGYTLGAEYRIGGESA